MVVALRIYQDESNKNNPDPGRRSFPVVWGRTYLQYRGVSFSALVGRVACLFPIFSDRTPSNVFH